MQITQVEMKQWNYFTALVAVFFLFGGCGYPGNTPIRVLVELNMGESQDVILRNGEEVNLKLIELDAELDSCRQAVRGARIRVAVDGEEVILNTGNYHLPVAVGKVQIDCPVIRAYYDKSNRDSWSLSKDAVFRLWPAGAPYLKEGTFVFPLKQEWLAGKSQAGNEPTYVDWGEKPGAPVYYHDGFDIGAAEGLDEVLSATGGLVLSSKNRSVEGYRDFPGDVRADVVYILDARGWCYRYSHLDSILPVIEPGKMVKAGQKIGFAGKQGHSGGWVHLHFGISHKEMSSGDWGSEDAFPYLWEAYCRQYQPALIALARPHRLTWTGIPVKLDGSKSKSMAGEVVSWEWLFSDGTSASGAVQEKAYAKAGEYSEVLKVTDSKGNVDYDFTVVQVYEKADSGQVIPTIQAAYHPTQGIKPGDQVIFLVRTFNSIEGNEEWDFGDGSPRVSVKSDTVDRSRSSEGDFARTSHAYSESGDYIVSVSRTNEEGLTATTHLHVKVNGKK